MTYDELNAAAARQSLTLLGGFHPGADEHLPNECQTLVLLGPQHNFWTAFEASPEWQDEQPVPDREGEAVVAVMFVSVH